MVLLVFSRSPAFQKKALFVCLFDFLLRAWFVMIFTWKSTSEQITTASAPATSSTAAAAAHATGVKQQSIFDLKLPRFLKFRRPSGGTSSSVDADDGDFELLIGGRMTKSATACSPRSGRKIDAADQQPGKHDSGTDSTMVNGGSKPPPMLQSLSLTPMLNRKLILCGSRKGKGCVAFLPTVIAHLVCSFAQLFYFSRVVIVEGNSK